MFTVCNTFLADGLKHVDSTRIHLCDIVNKGRNIGSIPAELTLQFSLKCSNEEFSAHS